MPTKKKKKKQQQQQQQKKKQIQKQIQKGAPLLGSAKSIYYTVIPNNEELQALRFLFDQRTIKEPSSEILLRLAELVLTLNCFSFADNHYKQFNSLAMGTKMGPSYAYLFVGYIENQFATSLMAPNLNFTAATSTIVLALRHLLEKNLIIL